MPLEKRIAWASLSGPALSLLTWGASGLGWVPPIFAYYFAVIVGGLGTTIFGSIWFYIGWVWIRAKGLQLGPSVIIAAGLLLVATGGIWGAITWSSPTTKFGVTPVSSAPNISFQKFALFWVETEPHVYYLAVVTKLFNADDKSHYLNGLTFARTEWKLIPRGGYLIRRYTEFSDKVDFIEDNYIRPNDVGYYKKLLPIRVDMTIVGGVLPDFILLGHWEMIFGSQKFALVPRMFGICNSPLSNAEWNDLLKPKSQIEIENLTYFPVPTKLSDWNEATIIGVPCVPVPTAIAPPAKN